LERLPPQDFLFPAGCGGFAATASGKRKIPRVCNPPNLAPGATAASGKRKIPEGLQAPNLAPGATA